MSYPYLHSPSDRFNWQMLAEILIPTSPGQQVEAIDHVASTLSKFDLEPRQVNQIMSAIDRALDDLEGFQGPLHLRISVSGLEVGALPTVDNQDRQGDRERAGGGLGFFLVKRIVGQLQDPDPAKYRLLEVLIYRESQ